MPSLSRTEQLGSGSARESQTFRFVNLDPKTVKILIHYLHRNVFFFMARHKLAKVSFYRTWLLNPLHW